ncbi:MAG: hypothetical protein HXX17_00725 [Geobacteraceae bacterium]|nr:hypothetical protein [Geobacteraceae bacterium]
MIQHPAVMSLLLSSFMITAMSLYASYYGLKIILKWDMGSGSELQLGLERRTYLISTILGYTLFFQILSFFLLIYTADSIHNLFTGAMCAAGSLGANVYGYPLLTLKLSNAVFCGVWLTFNHIDNKGYDYPLIKWKYRLLLLLAVLLTAETVLQFSYFANLKADLITSCCGSLFSPEKRGIAGELAGLPAQTAMILYAAFFGAYLVCGLLAVIKGRGWYLFATGTAGQFLISIAALISFISLYFYELPTHHCPFCILQKEYGYIGYLLYGLLIGGVISGVAAGAAEKFKSIGTLAGIIPQFQRRAAGTSVILNSLFAMIVLIRIFTTTFRL